MPKSKKKKKQDFQKVKLKVGKKLPKGDNVTNLSFKTRQIQLTQRIKDDIGQGIITKKKLTPEDLLRQCEHHSSNARVNAVAGLKELWLINSAELMIPTNPHGYGAILKKLSSLLVDNEAVVRHSVINLFKMILHKLGPKSSGYGISDKLGGTLYSYIHAYLCCAMNHVHEDIKLDALILFDTLLDSFPHLMVQQTGDLLKNLLGLISAPAYLGAKGNSITQHLSLNPDSKLPAMKFRARVLLRMKRTFMEALGDQYRGHLPSETCQTNLTDRTWSLCSEHYIKQNTCLSTYLAENRFRIMFSGGSHELDDYIIKASSLQAFLKISIPVLLQCWREAEASIDAQSSSDTVLSADSVEVMSLVACVIQLMFALSAKLRLNSSWNEPTDMSLVSPEFLVKNYQPDFEKLLMGKFPFSTHVQTLSLKKRKKNKGKQSIDGATVKSSLLALNLAVCDIMSSFCCDPTFRPKQESLKKLDAYVVRFLQKSPSMEQSKIITRILKNVFMNPGAVGGFVQAYKSAFEYYLVSPFKAPQKLQFFSLFAYIGQAWDGWHKSEAQPQPVCHYKSNSDLAFVLETFFQDLPCLLINVVRLGEQKKWILDILTLMSHGHVQKHSQTFLESFGSKLSELLDPTNGVVACEDECVQQRFFFLLSLGIRLTEDHLKQLLFVIRRPVEKPVLQRRKSWSIVSHAIYSLTSGVKKCLPLASQNQFNQISIEQSSHLSDYLRFMFSLQLGMTGEELDSCCPVKSDNTDKELAFSIDFSLHGDQWERHVEIAKLVARELANWQIPALPSEGYSQVFTFHHTLEQLWKQTLINRSRVHMLTAYSLVQFFYQVSLPHVVQEPSGELCSLTSSVVAAVLSHLFHLDNASLLPNEDIVWEIKCQILMCLTQNPSLLQEVMELLTKQSQDVYATEDDKQGSKTAQDFLLLDENIKMAIAKLAAETKRGT